MNAGILDRRITIQERLTKKSSIGEDSESWVFLTNSWAKRKFENGNINLVGGQEYKNSKLTYDIRYRNLSPLNYRLVDNSEVFDIENVDHKGRKSITSLSCRSTTAAEVDVNTFLFSVDTGIEKDFQAVTYANHLKLWVAVGVSDALMTSTDRVTWTSYDFGQSASLTDITYSPELEIICACGSAAVYTSTDAVNWTKHTLTGTFKSVDWSSSGNYFVSLGNVRAAYSPNGTGWGEATIDIVNAWSSIASNDNVFVGVSTAGRVTTKAASNPTSSWTSVAENSEVWNSITWSEDLNIFVVVGENGAVMTGDSNGLNWSVSFTSELNNWQEVVWVSDIGKLIACSNNGTNRFIESTDGVTWVNTFNSLTKDFTAMHYSGHNRAMIAVTGGSEIGYLRT